MSPIKNNNTIITSLLGLNQALSFWGLYLYLFYASGKYGEGKIH